MKTVFSKKAKPDPELFRRLCERYGLKVDPDALVEDISVGMQQRVEILKMLYRDNEILIFDEPTAVLTPQEIEELMQIMKNLAAEGKSILFISHKLNEVSYVADEITVIRDGATIETIDNAGHDIDSAQLGQLALFKAFQSGVHFFFKQHFEGRIVHDFGGTGNAIAGQVELLHNVRYLFLNILMRGFFRRLFH